TAVLLVMYVLPVFFFQAEDGIRVRNVTGVQTCALPISSGVQHAEGQTLLSLIITVTSLPFGVLFPGLLALAGAVWILVWARAIRSEERRVGTEGRDRAAA